MTMQFSLEQTGAAAGREAEKREVAQPSEAKGTVATALADALVRLGVTHAFGVMGGAIAPFFRAVAESAMTMVHTRHEAGAAFSAIEASLALRRPVLVFTTAGPGVTNAVTGMQAARWEGAQVIFVSASTSATNRGRVATQETSAELLGSHGVYLSGGPLHLGAIVEHPAQLGSLVARLTSGLARPGGFVAHVSLPIDLQRAPCVRLLHVERRADPAPACAPATIREHARRFSAEPPVIWVGFGARHAASSIRRLVDRLDARVMCSPRGKGIVSEDDPRFLGVTGLGGHPWVEDALARARPQYTLVLGTRMGESTSFWADALLPEEAFVHVDIDPSAFGVAYPCARAEAVVADIDGYVTALLEALGPASDGRRAIALEHRTERSLVPRAAGGVRPQLLFQELQRVVVERSDAWLMAECGNAFCWSTHHLRLSEPHRYRVSTGFGSMGHATTGVLGAAIARKGKAFALVGDGAMIMLNELHTAVQYGAPAVWLVLNDACYLMCAQGMQVMGWEPIACDLPRVDFVALARAMGADGEAVQTELEVAGALERALAARGPWVIDVTIDRREVPPSGRRNQSLMQQGFHHRTSR